MGGPILRRLAGSLLLFFLVLTFTFFLVHLAPGDPIALFKGPQSDQARLDQLRTLYGLDQPLPVQYFQWLRQVVFHFNWGDSFGHSRPAHRVILDALPKTFLLGTTALVLQYLLGIVLGISAARRAGGLWDHSLRIGSLVIVSIPTFWLGLMAVLIFHLHLGLLPASGSASVGAESLSYFQRWLDTAWHLILPGGIIAVISSGVLARFVRNGLLDTLQEPYVQTARAKGLSQQRVLWGHALRNSLVPLVQLFGMSIPGLLNGVLVIEVVFGWPGLGRVMFDAFQGRDYPVVLAGTALTAALVILGNLLADLLHRAVDPRVRHA